MPFIPLHDTTPRIFIALPWTTWLLIVGSAVAYLGQTAGGDEVCLRLVYGLGVTPAVLSGGAALVPQHSIAHPLVTRLAYHCFSGAFLPLAGHMLSLWGSAANVEKYKDR